MYKCTTFWATLYREQTNENTLETPRIPNSHDKTVLSVSCLPRPCELDSRQLKTIADRKPEV